MKCIFYIIMFFIGYSITSFIITRSNSQINSDSATPPEICFRKHGPSCIDLIIKEIDSAKSTIDFEFYNFTHEKILDALIDAAARGIRIRSIGDRSSIKEAGKLIDMLPGEIYVDCSVRIHHDKVLIIDNSSVGTGSFNFTYSAENSNAENHIWIHDPTTAMIYELNFEGQLKESTKGTSCK